LGPAVLVCSAGAITARLLRCAWFRSQRDLSTRGAQPGMPKVPG